MQNVLSALRKIQGIEARNKEFFENLALEIILEFPEFHVVKEAIEAGTLKIDQKLAGAELQNATTDAEQRLTEANEEETAQEISDKAELTEEERGEIELAKEIMGEDEIKIKRSFANALTQGTALDKMYLFKYVKTKLDEVNADLYPNYGLACSIVQILYYIMPPNIEGAARDQGGMGSEEVYDEGDGVYVIKARGVIFPFLVHEIVKGIQEWNSYMDETRDASSQDTLESETDDINYSQGLVAEIIKLIPDNFLKYRLPIEQGLLRLPIDELKEMLQGGAKGQNIVRGIIQDILLDKILTMTPDHLNKFQRQIREKLSKLKLNDLEEILNKNYEKLIAIYDELNPQNDEYQDSGSYEEGDEEPLV